MCNGGNPFDLQARPSAEVKVGYLGHAAGRRDFSATLAHLK